MWEVGMLSGFLFENMWTESHPDTIYWICIGICVTLLLMYEFFTHPWYYKKNGGKTSRMMISNVGLSSCRSKNIAT